MKNQPAGFRRHQKPPLLQLEQIVDLGAEPKVTKAQDKINP
tara:strand:+ start:1248 stop:1370 length:123 start_codon:yes stop_codon:yes gene_type:complete